MSTATETLRTTLLVGSAVTVGLQAGTYVAFAVGVMPGLARVDDRTFVSTMAQVNLAIVNPVFLATFVGAPVLAVALAALSTPAVRPWAVAAAVLAVATAVVTVVGNVPLNDALAAAGPDLAAARDRFESSWVRLNLVRAATGTLALAALGLAASRR